MPLCSDMDSPRGHAGAARGLLALRTEDDLPDLGISNLWEVVQRINANKAWHVEAFRLFTDNEPITGHFHVGKQLFAAPFTSDFMDTLWDPRDCRSPATIQQSFALRQVRHSDRTAI